MSPHWFFRMAQWARNPPSGRRVVLVFAVIGIVLAIVLLERAGLWPEALTAERMHR